MVSYLFICIVIIYECLFGNETESRSESSVSVDSQCVALSEKCYLVLRIQNDVRFSSGNCVNTYRFSPNTVLIEDLNKNIDPL